VARSSLPRAAGAAWIGAVSGQLGDQGEVFGPEIVGFNVAQHPSEPGFAPQILPGRPGTEEDVGERVTNRLRGLHRPGLPCLGPPCRGVRCGCHACGQYLNKLFIHLPPLVVTPARPARHLERSPEAILRQERHERKERERPLTKVHSGEAVECLTRGPDPLFDQQGAECSALKGGPVLDEVLDLRKPVDRSASPELLQHRGRSLVMGASPGKALIGTAPAVEHRGQRREGRPGAATRSVHQHRCLCSLWSLATCAWRRSYPTRCLR